MAARRALLDLLECAGQLLREGTKTDYTSLTNLVLRELAATARALAADAEAEIEARSAPFPASLPPWLVMQWLPIREVPAALRVAWSWRLDSEHYFRVFAERHRSLVSVACCGSVYFKWENHVKSLIQMQRSGRLTEFQEQVLRHYRPGWTEGEFRFPIIPIGEIIRDVRVFVHDATAEQVKTAVANLVSLARLRASTTGGDACRGHIDEWTIVEQEVLRQRVLDYFEEHATSDEGLATNAVAAGLSVDLALVEFSVDVLCTLGLLYSTIDEDHYKCPEGGGSLLYLYEAPDY